MRLLVGRTILGDFARAILCDVLPTVLRVLNFASQDAAHLWKHVQSVEVRFVIYPSPSPPPPPSLFSHCSYSLTYELSSHCQDQDSLRSQVIAANLVAFVANHSILPRLSGVSDAPLPSAIPFSSPPSLLKYVGCLPSLITLSPPHKGNSRSLTPAKWRGWQYQEGSRSSVHPYLFSSTFLRCTFPVNLREIVGGGYHGKSTLLNAIELGFYNKVFSLLSSLFPCLPPPPLSNHTDTWRWQRICSL